MTDASSKYKMWIYLMASVGALLAALFAYHFVYRYPIWTLHAFVVPSSSFCPTICKGERVFVQMQFGEPYIPRRGDVIVFPHGPDQVNYIKRVMGIPGDVVAPGPGNTILVNGQPWQPPSACAKSLLARESDGHSFPPVSFQATKVPNNQIFVVGDNLNNSFDSRIDQFGTVGPDQVIGKPVMIYWSPESSRIGCPIQ
jgi:signal peptidase I